MKPLCDPFDPVNVAKRESAKAACGNEPSKRAWLDELKSRQEAGEILMPAQLDLLRKANRL